MTANMKHCNVKGLYAYFWTDNYCRKKAKDTKEPVKQKKSPVGGWKSFFTKSRSSSLKVGKGRKSSVPGKELSFKGALIYELIDKMTSGKMLSVRR